MANLKERGSQHVVQNGRQMSYILEHFASCAYFQSCFLVGRGSGGDTPTSICRQLRQSIIRICGNWDFFPWLPLPCLFFTSRTTEKANIIFYLTNKDTEALNRGLWTKIYACGNCEIGKLLANWAKKAVF